VIFDAHMHVGDFPGLFDVSLHREGLEALMAECGIDQVLLFYPDNAYVREVVEAVPGAYALVWANPTRPGHLEEVEHFLEHPRFLGVKLHPLLDSYPPADAMVDPLWRLAAERDVPVLAHTGHPIFTLPWSYEDVARKHPDVRLVLGHMGHGNVVYVNAAIDVAERNPNVYLETSGMPMHTKIAEAVRRVGPTRVLYGSDAPFHHPAVEILRVRVAGLSDDDLERVLARNAQRLFLGSE
jgi:uncharacterized protein